MQNLKRKIAQKKSDTPVYRYGVVEDRYGNESYSYPKEPDANIHVLWIPVSGEVEIAEYGERVNAMMQACLFDDTQLKEKDRVEINSTMHTVVSIKPFPSYRLVLAERVV